MTILIIDDDTLVANALKTILEADPEMQVCATGNDGASALGLYQTYTPDILLMDIQMRNMNGLDASLEILSQYPDAKILLLTTFSDDEYITRALRIGAKGYLLKQDYQSILPAIRAVSTGQRVFGDEIIAKIPDLLQRASTFDGKNYGLNEREMEVTRLVANGLSNKEISEQLYLSEGTIRNYISSILEKLALRDRTQLAVFYYQHQ